MSALIALLVLAFSSLQAAPPHHTRAHSVTSPAEEIREQTCSPGQRRSSSGQKAPPCSQQEVPVPVPGVSLRPSAARDAAAPGSAGALLAAPAAGAAG